MRKTIIVTIVLALTLTTAAWGAMGNEEFVNLCQKGSAQEIRNALLQGASPNAVDKSRKTALMKAAGNNTPEVVSLLLKAGAGVNAKDKSGNTALMGAAYNGNPEIISLLLKTGADVNAKNDDGETALMKAAWDSIPEIVSLLLEAGADVNTKDEGGWTALMEAAISKKNPEVLSLLLKAGADVNAKNKGGKTALDLAREKNNTGAIKVLEAAGGQVSPEGLYQFGIKYLTGDGVAADEQKGLDLLRQAAAQGHQKAKDALKLYE